MNQDLINQLQYLLKKHEDEKEEILQALSTAENTPEQKGKIVLLLTSYRNNLDTLKQETSEAIKMVNQKDT